MAELKYSNEIIFQLRQQLVNDDEIIKTLEKKLSNNEKELTSCRKQNKILKITNVTTLSILLLIILL